jgi:hypothetical protein
VGRQRHFLFPIRPQAQPPHELGLPSLSGLDWSSKVSPRSVLEQVLRFATEVGLPVTLAEIGLTDLPPESLHQVANRAALGYNPP